MQKHSMMRLKLRLLFLVTCITISSVTGNSVHIVADTKLDNVYEHSNTNSNSLEINNMTECKRDEFSMDDIFFLNNTDIFLQTNSSLNITVHSSNYHIIGEKVYVCLITRNDNRYKLIGECKDKFAYASQDFQIFASGSALVFGDIIQPEQYELQDGMMLICKLEDDIDRHDAEGWTSIKSFVYAVRIGSIISILSLIMQLLTIYFLPSLKNLPGHNLTYLSVAFLLAHFFVLIGLMQEVTGVFCSVSAILQQNFFLMTFFCINVMAFDVWRTIKLATENLTVDCNNGRKRQYLGYSLYVWGCPFIISIISVIIDNIQGVQEKFKPYYGRGNICWMNSLLAKVIFFAVPVFILCMVTGKFFLFSARIFYNTRKCTNNQKKQTVQLICILYVIECFMMELPLLTGIVTMVTKSVTFWFVTDFINSLQGLLLFLLFTCTRKVILSIRRKTTLKSHTSENIEIKSQ